MSETELQTIHNLLGSYGVLLDQLLVEQWLDLFAEESILDVDGNHLDSREKRHVLATTAPRGLHVSSLPVVSGELTSHELFVTSTFLFWNIKLATTRTGWYEDRLVREGTEWRFAARRVSFLDGN